MLTDVVFLSFPSSAQWAFTVQICWWRTEEETESEQVHSEREAMAQRRRGESWDQLGGIPSSGRCQSRHRVLLRETGIMYAHVCIRFFKCGLRRLAGVLLCHSPSYSIETGSLMDPMPAFSLQFLEVLLCSYTYYQHMWLWPAFYMSTVDSNSGPHGYTASTLAHWALSPTRGFILATPVSSQY